MSNRDDRKLRKGKLESEETIKLNTEKLVEKATTVDSELTNLTSNVSSETERKELIREYTDAQLADIGIQPETRKVITDQFTQGDVVFSEFAPKIASVIFSQIGNFALADYQLEGLIKINTSFINGMVTMFYNAQGAVDRAKRAYGDVTIADFNGEIPEGVAEDFRCTYEFGTKFKVLNPVGNDFAFSQSLFLATLVNYYKEVIRPIAKEMLRLTYKFIADWQTKPTEATMNGVTPVQVDITENFKDEKDIILFIKNMLAEYKNPSILNVSRLNWRPTGLSKDMEISTVRPKLLMSYQLANDIDVNILSGIFQLNKMNIETDLVLFDPDRTFNEIGDVTGVDKYNVFLISEGALGIMAKYEIGKTVQTPKAYDILHTYQKYGTFVDKTKVALNIKFKKSDGKE